MSTKFKDYPIRKWGITLGQKPKYPASATEAWKQFVNSLGFSYLGEPEIIKDYDPNYRTTSYLVIGKIIEVDGKNKCLGEIGLSVMGVGSVIRVMENGSIMGVSKNDD